jgi:hypothetical protein
MVSFFSRCDPRMFQSTSDYDKRLLSLLDAVNEKTCFSKANVVEAACARISGEINGKQQTAMLVFMVVTIFFVSDTS